MKFVVAEFSFHCWLFDNIETLATSSTTLEICNEALNQAIQIIKDWFKKGTVGTIIYDSTKDKQGDRFSSESLLFPSLLLHFVYNRP